MSKVHCVKGFLKQIATSHLPESKKRFTESGWNLACRNDQPSITVLALQHQVSLSAPHTHLGCLQKELTHQLTAQHTHTQTTKPESQLETIKKYISKQHFIHSCKFSNNENFIPSASVCWLFKHARARVESCDSSKYIRSERGKRTSIKHARAREWPQNNVKAYTKIKACAKKQVRLPTCENQTENEKADENV